MIASGKRDQGTSEGTKHGLCNIGETLGGWGGSGGDARLLKDVWIVGNQFSVLSFPIATLFPIQGPKLRMKLYGCLFQQFLYSVNIVSIKCQYQSC